jgi:threonine/homoserine/homoserine lactone efflux protein
LPNAGIKIIGNIMKIVKNGLITGLILQLAIGPVFFFIINLTLQRTILDGLIAVLAVTIVDYFYITLAILGIGKLLERKKVKKIFGIISSIVLIIFGGIIIKDVLSFDISTDVATISSNLLTSFTSVFFLTISSPMTIVFFTSLFAAKAVEYNYTKQELLIFGLATGSATLIFLGTSVILFSLIGGAIPITVIRILNLTVGILLIGYGTVRLAKVFLRTANNMVCESRDY